ncbi:MAG: M50 family metallopeptidase [Sulfobacillus sp.]
MAAGAADARQPQGCRPLGQTPRRRVGWRRRIALITLLAFLLAVGVLIVVHEGGHFLVARATGIGVREFAVGFGKRLVSVTRGGTRYAINMLPLGGYVMLAGMDGTDVKPSADNFQARPLWARLLTISAGPVANYLLAVVLFAWVLAGWGIPTTSGAVIGQVLSGYPAAAAGVRPGDRVVAMDGHPITTWSQISTFEATSGTHPIHLLLERNGRTFTLTVTPVQVPGAPAPEMGVTAAVTYHPISVPSALAIGWQETAAAIAATAAVLWGAAAHGVAPPLVGVVGIASLAGQSLAVGVSQFIVFAAILSVNLALFNLLPIPPLDGSRLVFIAVEGIRRKPLSRTLELAVNAVGFYLLIAAAAVLAVHDVTGRL